jgi:hypothetical protein
MRLLKSVLDFYIRSSLHVAVCFVALAIVYLESYNLSTYFGYYVFLFCSALAGYNLIKYGLIWLKQPMKSNISLKFLTALSSAIALYLTIYFSKFAWLLLIIICIINLLYVLPIWRGKGLRYSPFFKLFSVAIVWSVLVVGIPQFLYIDTFSNFSNIEEYRMLLEPNKYLDQHTLKIFTLVIALCIPFEIRDLKYDEEDLHTLPQVLGVKISKIIGVVLCAFYLMIIGYGNSRGLPIYSHEIIMIVITAVAIWFSDQFKSDYYASFFVEAIPLLWLGLYCLV